MSLVLASPVEASADSPDRLRASAERRLHTARALLAVGGVQAAALAGAALVDVRPGTIAVAPHSTPRGVPESVGRLAAAVEHAARRVARSLPGDPDAVEDAYAEALRAMVEGRHPSTATTVADPATSATILALLAEAVDRAIPDLRAYARAMPASAATTACDVADVPPALCVAGSGPNVHRDDYALVVDLGGDDVHANGAGGADPLGNGLSVSVTVDLGGSDRYATALPTASGGRVAHGAGLGGGVGLLVDAGGGDDEYEAVASTTNAPAHAQGVGIGGAGLLADLGGNDRYRVANVGTPAVVPVLGVVNAAHYATGLGWGMLGGIGIVADAYGDDQAVVESRPEMAVVAEFLDPGSNVYAQGFGAGYLGGAGLFTDGGGNDAPVLRAWPARVAPDEPRESGRARAWAAGFGFGSFGGVGAVINGAGTTAYTASALVAAPMTQGTEVDAFGVGTVGGIGLLEDAGGHDRYVAEARARGERRRSVTQACDCDGVEATVRVEGTPATPERAVLALVHGHGALAGAGLLRDLGGDDRYETVAVAEAVAAARDDRDAPVARDRGAVADVVARNVQVLGQGYGTAGGVGTLVDGDGHDRYEVDISVSASAAATAAASEIWTFAASVSGDAVSTTQGYGALGGEGELRDSGGTDTYGSSAATAASADPPSVRETGDALARVQGSVENGGVAVLADADGGADDRFSSSPADPACSGTKGQGIWRACESDGAGLGANA